jgi:REP element-mobilizing transposase RayT
MPRKQRKNNRWLGYDYSLNADYFVTICVGDKQNYFGEIRGGVMFLNQVGQIAKRCWLDLPNHYANCELDTFIVMPNHLHGIIRLDDSKIVGNGLKPFPTKRYSLSEIIRGFKTFSSRQIHEITLLNNFRWQKSFYDHVIWSPEYLDKIRLYIQNNPMKWAGDNGNLDDDILTYLN